MTSPCGLPLAVSEEILRKYADVLRVGNMLINGVPLCWETDTSTQVQLENFCNAFCPRLKEVLPELDRANPAALCFAAYWFCKSVSINYALIEVLLMIQRRVGVFCTIETRESGVGNLVEYKLEANAERNTLEVSLMWKKANNIVYRSPDCSQPQVKGTLSCLATQFKLPPEEGFLPAYRLHMRLRRSIASHFVSRVACGVRRSRAPETICIEEPLRSYNPLETLAELAARTPQDVGPTTLERNSRPASPGAFETSRAFQRPDTDTLRKTRDRLGLPEEPEALLGELRVSVLRVLTTIQKESGSCRATALEFYATCQLAGCVHRAGIAAEGLQTWTCPLHGNELREEVILEVFDNSMYDAQGRLDFLGRIAVPVSIALCDPSSAASLVFPLRTGSVEIGLQFVPSVPSVSPSTTPDEDEAYDECDVEIGGAMLHANILAPMRPLISVRSAAPSVGTGRGLWCSKNCAVEFS